MQTVCVPGCEKIFQVAPNHPGNLRWKRGISIAFVTLLAFAKSPACLRERLCGGRQGMEVFGNERQNSRQRASLETQVCVFVLSTETLVLPENTTDV